MHGFDPTSIAAWQWVSAQREFNNTDPMVACGPSHLAAFLKIKLALRGGEGEGEGQWHILIISA